MRSRIVRVSAVAAFLVIAAATAARADVCVTIDTARDTLPPGDQAAALLLVTKEFEQAGEHVVPAGCPASYVISHIKLGNVIVVTLSGPNGEREGTAFGMDDLPPLYDQMVRAIVTGRNAIDRTNVTEAQATANRIHTDSIWYARIGYGSVFGDQAYTTPAFGFGYRAELDSLGIDVSFLNYQFRKFDYDYYAPSASAGSLLKLSGLYFLNPHASRTAYLGGGLSYGNTNFSDSRPDRLGLYRSQWEGSGLQSELTIGYELARATSLRMFLQADAVLPFYQVSSATFSRTGVVSTDHRYAPSFIVSIGVGK